MIGNKMLLSQPYVSPETGLWGRDFYSEDLGFGRVDGAPRYGERDESTRTRIYDRGIDDTFVPQIYPEGEVSFRLWTDRQAQQLVETAVSRAVEVLHV